MKDRCTVTVSRHTCTPRHGADMGSLLTCQQLKSASQRPHQNISKSASANVCMQGGYRACNRIGIESSTSSFLKISFETAAHFLTQATLAGTVDPLTSPAARIVMGRQVQLGTGSFSLIHDLGSCSEQ